MGNAGIGSMVGGSQSAVERGLRPHPSIEELEAYHRGRLDAESHERLVDHLTQCRDCTILLLFGVIDAEGKGQESGIPGIRSAEAWDRLRRRLPTAHRRGRTLGDILGHGERLPLKQAVDLAVETTRALARLHARGRLLSDLRPENIVVEPGGEVRFLDVGLAPTAESFEVGYGRPLADALVDLYRFLSPEQVVREHLTPRSNLFSLGALLYELLTGISPFRDSTPLATASRILSLDPEPVSELVPEVDTVLSELIDQLLAKDPEQRPRDAGWVARELERMVEWKPPKPARAPLASGIEAEIEDLYDQIIRLSEEADPGREDEIESTYARLVKLQTAEAERFRERFEASLEMPIDAGEQILARAQKLREELEDLAAGDAAPTNPDSP